DHGPQYTGADCRDLCDEWGLEHTFAPVGRPTGNGLVERFILTLKIELIWTRDWASADELRDAVLRWLEDYHGERPHQALNWLTPREKRAATLGLQVEVAA
ncbi:MAG: transposase, partial [Acidobacteria bacterium]